MRPKTDISFKAFWDSYAYKRDRYAAELVWKRMSDKEKRAALAGISRYREECQRTGVSMMHGRNYLLHRRWEDELDEQDGSVHARSRTQSPLEEMEIW